MTGTDVITDRVRPILDDEDVATERWSDDLLIIWLNEGSRIIAEKRPESLLTAPYTQATYADIVGIGDTVIVPDKYRDALTDYVCSRALNQDSQDERDLARARDHWRGFVSKAGLTGVIPLQGRATS
jgi:hypothetical protein